MEPIFGVFSPDSVNLYSKTKILGCVGLETNEARDLIAKSVKYLSHVRKPFALAFMRGKKFYLARDRIGLQPLYFRKVGDKVFFTQIKQENFVPVRPGTVWSGRTLHSFKPKPRKGTLKELALAIEEAVAETSGSTVAFSGGLDSSLVAFLASKFRKIELHSVGVKGTFSIAEEAAEILGLPLRKHTIVGPQKALPDVRKILNDDNFLQQEIALAEYFLFRNIPNRKVLVGQGADEVFGGYNRYEHMKPNVLKREMSKDLANIAPENLDRDNAVALHFGVQLECPFLNLDVVELALGFPSTAKVSSGVRKLLLRKAAALLGLPEKLINRPKKAMQYSTGVHRELTKHAGL